MLIRSIFDERENPRYNATHFVPAVFAPGVWSHGPKATELLLKLPDESAKNPTVFNPPSCVPLLPTTWPRPLSAAGS